jgi:hypothetical protein
MEKTAVEFLMGKLFDPSTMVSEQIQWFEQAKEMEKQQIIKAHGNKKKNARDVKNYQYTYTGEMYFNDNYFKK